MFRDVLTQILMGAGIAAIGILVAAFGKLAKAKADEAAARTDNTLQGMAQQLLWNSCIVVCQSIESTVRPFMGPQGMPLTTDNAQRLQQDAVTQVKAILEKNGSAAAQHILAQGDELIRKTNETVLAKVVQAPAPVAVVPVAPSP